MSSEPSSPLSSGPMGPKAYLLELSARLLEPAPAPVTGFVFSGNIHSLLAIV